MPNCFGLISYLRINYHIEKYAAIKNQKLRNFENILD